MTYSNIYSTSKSTLNSTFVPSPILPNSSIYTSSSSPTLLILNSHELIQLLPTLKLLANSSIILQVSTLNSNDHTKILAIRSSGIALLYSSNQEQANVNASIAIKVARAGKGVLHFGEFTSEVINLAREENNSVAIVGGTSSTSDVFTSAYASTPLATPLTYFGNTSPTTLIIALGNTSTLINSLPTSSALISLNLYRPLSSSTIRNLVPSSVTTLVVLEQTYRQVSKWTPVFLDVVGAFAESDDSTVVPTILSGILGTTTDGVAAIKTIFG